LDVSAEVDALASAAVTVTAWAVVCITGAAFTILALTLAVSTFAVAPSIEELDATVFGIELHDLPESLTLLEEGWAHSCDVAATMEFDRCGSQAVIAHDGHREEPAGRFDESNLLKAAVLSASSIIEESGIAPLCRRICVIAVAIGGIGPIRSEEMEVEVHIDVIGPVQGDPCPWNDGITDIPQTVPVDIDLVKIAFLWAVVAGIAPPVAVYVSLIVADLGTVVVAIGNVITIIVLVEAAVTQSVSVFVRLVWIGDPRTIVTFVPDAIFIHIGLVEIIDQRAVVFSIRNAVAIRLEFHVTGIAPPISIAIRLVGVGRLGAIITGVAHAIHVSITLVSIGEGWAVVTGCTHTVFVAVIIVVGGEFDAEITGVSIGISIRISLATVGHAWAVVACIAEPVVIR